MSMLIQQQKPVHADEEAAGQEENALKLTLQALPPAAVDAAAVSLGEFTADYEIISPGSPVTAATRRYRKTILFPSLKIDGAYVEPKLGKKEFQRFLRQVFFWTHPIYGQDMSEPDRSHTLQMLCKLIYGTSPTSAQEKTDMHKTLAKSMFK